MDGEMVCREIPGAAFLYLDEISPNDCRFHSHATPRFTFLYHGIIVEIDESGHQIEGRPISLHVTPAHQMHGHSFKSQRVATLCFDLLPPITDWLGRSMCLFEESIFAFDANIANLARRFRQEVLTADNSSELVLQGLIFELIGELNRGDRDSQKAPPQWVLNARSILEDSWNQRLSIDQLAAAVGVHPSHLNRTFRACIGQTPGEYLRGVRLRRATKAVQNTPMPLKEIACLAGYADQAHFTREFRRFHGFTPAELRKSSRR